MTGDDELKGVPFICWYYLLSVTQVTDTDLIQPNLPSTSKPKPSRKRTNWLYVLWFFSKPLTILCHITWHFWHVISQRSLTCCIEGFSDLKLISSALTAEALSLNLQLRLNLKRPLWERTRLTKQRPVKTQHGKKEAQLNLITARFCFYEALVDFISSAIVWFGGWIV